MMINSKVTNLTSYIINNRYDLKVSIFFTFPAMRIAGICCTIRENIAPIYIFENKNSATSYIYSLLVVIYQFLLVLLTYSGGKIVPQCLNPKSRG